MSNENEIRNVIRTFITENVFQGNDKGELKDDTKLISSRLMDSIVALKLVSHLEEHFKIEFEAHEVDQDNLDTISQMTKFVQSKMK
ncbi:MAG: acyl carrier protein [Bacteroidetes bacterium]|nr:acyl carrier protein [Bacteroidota bacterium]